MSGVTGEIGFKIGAAGSQLPQIGGKVITAEPNQVALTVNGAPSQFALQVNGNPAPAAVSEGLLVQAGVGNNDVSSVITDVGGTHTLLRLLRSGSGQIGWNSSALGLINFNNSGTIQFFGVPFQVLNNGGSTQYFGISSSGASISNIVAGNVQFAVNEPAPSNIQQLAVAKPAVIIGTSAVQAWSTGASYPVLQFAAIGAIMGTATTGLVLMGGGLYYNGTNYIYGQAGTGIVASLGTGTFSISAFNTSGTAAGTAAPFVVMSVSGSSTQGVVVLGTGTNLPWGGGTAIICPLQFGVAGGIFGQPTGFNMLSGAYYNGTHYQFTGTGGGGTSTALSISCTGGGVTVAFGGVGTYTQQVAFTNIMNVSGTLSPVIQGYGPTAAALVDMTPDTGTFTGTWGGFIAAPVNTAAYWSRNGNQVHLLIPYGTGSKAGAAGNITFAMPAAASGGPPLPVKTQLGILPVCINGTTTSVGNVIVSSANATLTLQGLGGIAFVGTANASIGVTGDFTLLTYAIGP